MQEKVSSKKIQGKIPPEEKEMTFWDHLEELRAHVFRSLAVILIFSIAAFIAKRFVFDVIILAPKDEMFITNRILCKLGQLLSVDSLCVGHINLNMQNIEMSGQFMTHMYVSFVVGLVAAAPYVIFELWRFVMPALKPKERKHSRGAVLASSTLFILGVLFAYFLIVPLTINFFGSYQVSPDVPNQIHLSSYISTVLSVILGVGIVFELPVLIYFLTRVGLVSPPFLKKNRKYMLVIVLIISAIITPPDVFSQVLVTIPLMGLYELSIIVSKRVIRNQEAAEDD